MKYNRLMIFLFVFVIHAIVSTPVYSACTNVTCSSGTVCPAGYEYDRAGCKTCRCTPSPKSTKTWTFNMKINCPAGTVLTQKVRFFSASWIEGQNHPNGFYWDSGPYSYDLNRIVVLSNYTPSDTMYLGLESEAMVAKKLYNGGTTLEHQELIPTGTPPHSSMTYAKKFNPPTFMVFFSRDVLPQGTYSVVFSIPDQFASQWCVAPTPVPPTPTPTVKSANSPAWTRCLGDYKNCNDFCGSRGQVCSNSCTGFGGCTGTSIGYNQAEAYTINGSKCWNEGACTKKIESPPSSTQSQISNLCNSWFNTSCCCGGAVFTPTPIPTRVPTPIPPTPTPTPTSTPIPTPTPDPCRIRSQGDANCDLQINNTDLDIFTTFIRGKGYTNPSHSVDFNTDGKVNLVDYEIWRNSVYH